MTKKEIVALISKKESISKVEANCMYEAVVNAIVEAIVNGEEVAIPGFGKFEIKQRNERKARNPQTGEEVVIKAHKAVGFKPAKALKNTVAEL